MKKTLLAVAVSAAVVVPGMALASQGNYQFEAGAQYLYIDVDDVGNDNALGIDFTYHFAPVSTAGHPYGEAAFLERSSNISGAYRTYDDTDLDIFELGVEAFVEDFYIAAGLTRWDNGSSSNDIGVRLGYLPQDGLLLTVGYDREEDVGTNGDDLNTISFGAKYVNKLANDTALNLEGELSRSNDSEDTIALSLAGDYYFNRQFSVGLRLLETDNSDIDTAYGVGTRYFFTPLISGQLEYLTSDNEDAVWARLAARF